MTDDFKNHLRLLWKNGGLSDQTYCEMVGEVDFRTEKSRREKEIKDGTEVLMYPHITQNREDQESFEETRRHNKFYEDNKVDDKKGNPLPPDKTEPEQKEEFDISKIEIEGAPYKTVKDLPAKVKKNLSLELQRVFLRVFNNAYDTYRNDSRAFRIAWGVIRKLARKNKKGIWVRKSRRKKGKLIKVKLTRAMIDNILEKEEKEELKAEAKSIEDAIQLKKLTLIEKQTELADKLLKGNKSKKD
jgi:cation transport regulator